MNRFFIIMALVLGATNVVFARNEFVPYRMYVAQVSNNIQSHRPFRAVEREIMVLQKSNKLIGEDHYRRLMNELSVFEKQTINPKKLQKLKKLQKIVTQLLPSQVKSSPQPNRQENNSSAAAIKNEKEDEGKNKVCDPKGYDPVLTHDFTDNSAIQEITAPGTPTQDKDGVKGHSWVWTGGKKVPIYAPIAVYLEDAGRSRDNEYSPYDYGMDLRITDNNCWRIRYHHITIDAADSIKAAIQNKKEGEKIEAVSFNAGDLVGYTAGNVPSGNWDIGLYNVNKKGPLAHISQYVQHAVCWVDYYSKDKQSFYRSKLTGPKTVCSF